MHIKITLMVMIITIIVTGVCAGALALYVLPTQHIGVVEQLGEFDE